MMVLRRECVSLRDPDFMSAPFAPIYTGPRCRGGRLQNFVECFIAALFDELAVLVKRHRTAAPLLGEI